jgi:O-antigen ligase
LKGTLLAGLLLLPALGAITAGALGAADPATREAALTGWVGLGLIPLALAMLVRPPGIHRGAVGLVPALLGVAALSWLAAEGAGDGLERTRSVTLLAAGALAALAAAGLDQAGRRALVRGTIAIALCAVGSDLAGLPAEVGGFAGNTGELSDAVLPGALCGAALACTGRGRWRWAGGAAAMLLWAHALRTPVAATLVTGSVVLALASLVHLRAARRSALALAVAATAFVAGAAFLGSGALGQGARVTADAPSAPPAATDTGGIEVRARIWARTAAMTLDRPWLGVGPGQFAVQFPLHRDPLEIELSSHQRLQEQEREVEHPHNDLLLIASELGLAAALGWLVLAAAAGAAALRALRAGDEFACALALGSGGVLVAGLFNATLFYNPVASVGGFALLGALLGLPRAKEGGGVRRWPLRGAGIVYLSLCAWPAAGLARHGLALAAIAGGEPPSAAEVEGALDDALAARGDSVVALTLRARLLEQTGAETEELLGAWRAVLALRPHRVEPLLQLAVHHARRGDLEQARALFEATLEVDPGHPAALRNRAWLELSIGDGERGLSALDSARAAGRAGALWLTETGAKLVLMGREAEGTAVLALAHERLEGLTGETAWALSREYRTKDAALIADGLESMAHRLWAREHAADGRWEDAYRSLRQVLRITRRHVPGGPAPVRLELGASLWRARMPEDARAMVAGIPDAAALLAGLPAWVAEALEEM